MIDQSVNNLDQTEPEKFFHDLLLKTKDAFQKSSIKRYQEQQIPSKKWNYGICDTPIQKGKGILVGLNWGGDNHENQKDYPKLDKIRNWRFIKTSLPLLKKYLGIMTLDDLNYSNLSFFRTPKIKYMTLIDWKLSLLLFEKYVSYIKPSWILLLGTTGVKILTSLDYLTNVKKIKISGNDKKVIGYQGLIFNKYHFFCVPHPQSHISSLSRSQIWVTVLDKKMIGSNNNL
jgi:hypothetical protein